MAPTEAQEVVLEIAAGVAGALRRSEIEPSQLCLPNRPASEPFRDAAAEIVDRPGGRGDGNAADVARIGQPSASPHDANGFPSA